MANLTPVSNDTAASEPVDEAAGARAGTGAHYFRTPVGDAEPRSLALVLDGQPVDLLTADGVFSADRLDLGTQVLLREVPDPAPAGDLLDLGCGWGPLALALARRAPKARVWAVDVNERAVELTAQNAARLRLPGVRACTPDEVPQEIEFATIWSNPPIRIGKPALHELLLHWLPRLAPDGVAYLVVQRHLGADSLHAWLVEQLAPWQVVRVGSAKGYRVLRISR